MAHTPSQKRKPISHLKELLLLVAIPLGMLIIVAAYIYLPQTLAKPNYDFVFAACNSSYCDDSYGIDQSGKITHTVHGTGNEHSQYYDDTTRLYRYDVQTNSVSPIVLDDIHTYHLDSSSRSPDGYTLEHKNAGSSGFLLFYSREEGGWYLKNGWYRKPVQLPVGGYYYSTDENIQFIGWIKS